MAIVIITNVLNAKEDAIIISILQVNLQKDESLYISIVYLYYI